ncbi:MAG: hypothetical protein AAGC67_04250 [Myxococcota bacterium]
MLRMTRSRSILILALACLSAGPGAAQDWGSDDDWQPNENQLGGRTTAGPPTTPWSLRAGVGFTADPDNFLMNFELPYRFDPYVAAGPMLQVGLGDDRYLVAPTANLTITGANLFEGEMARFEPNLFAGIGFAVIENSERGGANRGAGFLVNAGVGLDYILSDRLTIGSRMIFNFLPGGTLDETFFYSWEIAGVRLNF